MRMLALFALGCTGSGVGNETDPDVQPGDTSPPTPAIESACDDTVDDDGDGAVDCNDSDCFEAELCSWPVSVDFSSNVFYDANALAVLGGASDCTVVTTSTLQRDRQQETCADCDRVFCGAFAYPQDNCPPGEEPRPDSGCFGYTFTSDTSWTMYGRNPDTQVWDQVAVLEGTGPLQWSSGAQPLLLEGTDVGTLTTSFTASPL